MTRLSLTPTTSPNPIPTGSIAAFVEAERRFGSRLVLELESRLFLDVDPVDALAVFAEDSFVTLRRSYFF